MKAPAENAALSAPGDDTSLRIAAALQPLVDRVRTDVTAARSKDGRVFWTRGEALTPTRLLAHVTGGTARGCCPIRADSDVTLSACLDFDSHKGEVTWADLIVVVDRVSRLARASYGLEGIAFRSGGGAGVNLWFTWEEAQPAWKVRKRLAKILEECGLKSGAKGVGAGEVEVFPKQDFVPPEGRGNMVVLPLSRKGSVLCAELGFEDLGKDGLVAVVGEDGRDWPMCRPIEWEGEPPPGHREFDALPRGVCEDPAEVAKLRSALAAIPNEGEGLDYDEWWKVMAAIMDFWGYSAEGYQMCHEFSERSDKYDAEFTDTKVLNYLKHRPGGITVGTVYKMAREVYGWQEDISNLFGDLGPLEDGEDAPPDVVPWPLRTPSGLDSYAPTPPRWLWDGYIPPREVTLFSGHGGSRKTTIALMLACCSAAGGQPLFGRSTRACKVVFFSAEDDFEQVMKTLALACRELKLDADAVSRNLLVVDATEHDAILFADRRADGIETGAPTSRMAKLQKVIDDFGPELVIIDNASEVFDSDEIRKARVRTFIKALKRFVRERDGAVLLLAHVDKATAKQGEGANTATAFSGSAAWFNSARAALYSVGSEDDPERFELRHGKASRGVRLPALRLRHLPGHLPVLEAVAACEQVDDPFRFVPLLEMLSEYYKRGEWVSPAATATNNAKKTLGAELRATRILKKEADVVQWLRDSERRGFVAKEAYGKPSARTQRWAVTDDGAALCRRYETGADLGVDLQECADLM